MLSQSDLQLASDPPPATSRAISEELRENTPHAAKGPRLLACVDETPMARAVTIHAGAVARSLGLEMTLARVIEEGGRYGAPVDPIEWQLRRQEHHSQLRKLAEDANGPRQPAAVLLSGDAGDELIDWSETHGTTLLALATRNDSGRHALGSTVLRLLEHGSASLLLVPPQARVAPTYRRILVPVDGSPRAESVIPVALIIARAHGAELILVHVVPPVRRLSGFRAGQAQDLHSEIERQNARGAREHLEQLRLRAQEVGLVVHSTLLGPAEPRQATCQFAREKDVDLVVMSSHGATALSDVPCGSVAEYLATHCTMPVLMVRPNLVTGFCGDDLEPDGQSVFRFG
ncbi:MAG: universal stress protein [Erythrobacter sp.]|jgi:nucleotide-binding universal stress UspA family protein|uniref:universal stress protein n=1 Tax=Erythrobacter sp. TaxID=1042 RepID=UPI001B0A527B|nr:universal stress protein [Erythrobacter sp.]MBO6767457.1 universal stress protein [Erythrobacter sp.]